MVDVADGVRWRAQAVEAQRAAAAGGTSLSWADTMKAGMAAAQLSGEIRQPPLIYSSRTHSQLTQVIRELRRTSYKCATQYVPVSGCCPPANFSLPHDSPHSKACGLGRLKPTHTGAGLHLQ